MKSEVQQKSGSNSLEKPWAVEDRCNLETMVSLIIWDFFGVMHKFYVWPK